MLKLWSHFISRPAGSSWYIYTLCWNYGHILFQGQLVQVDTYTICWNNERHILFQGQLVQVDKYTLCWKNEGNFFISRSTGTSWHIYQMFFTLVVWQHMKVIFYFKVNRYKLKHIPYVETMVTRSTGTCWEPIASRWHDHEESFQTDVGWPGFSTYQHLPFLQHPFIYWCIGKSSQNVTHVTLMVQASLIQLC